MEKEEQFQLNNFNLSTFHPNTTTTAASAPEDHSDDSSVELYGRSGRASPSSINGVLSGVGASNKSRSKHHPFLYNGDNNNDDDEKSQTPSILSHDAAQSVATFLSRMQHKFTPRSSPTNNHQNGYSTNNHHRSNKNIRFNKSKREQNAKYLSNFFYISTNPSDLLHTNNNNNSSSHEQQHSQPISLKLDINPQHHHHHHHHHSHYSKRDGFCLGANSNIGCTPQTTDLLSGCESVGNAVDTIFTWFSERGRECDPSSSQYVHVSRRSRNMVSSGGRHYGMGENGMVLQQHNGWMKNWQDGGGNNGSEKRVYLPPRLAVRGFR